ncbi:MAG TPA: CocE/NonD family hydrolase [Pirellulales bacterium]|nr:CocE/NonD family hydrolase [Pirellulales bacterium]
MRFKSAIVAWCVLASFAFAAEGPFGVEYTADVMVPMRDGVRLATDVYLPTRDGQPLKERLPTILMRTPYNKATKPNGAPDGRYFASHGYAVVMQDTRGRYHSEGVWTWMNDDGRDGVDTAAWIALQPWSNGKLGMIGTSYVGGTQHALAMENCPQLATVIPVDAVSNMGYASMRNGGAFELRFWNWIMLNAGRGSRAARDPGTAAALEELAEHRIDYLHQLPLRHGTTPLRLAPEYEQWLIEAMNHGANDAFWRQNNIIDHASQYKDIPVYLVGGWYDSWASNTTANFRALSAQLRGPVYLVMGPWIHGAQGSSRHGQVDFGPAAAIDDPLAWRRTWYDRWLKGIENEVGREAPFRTPVRIFVMGTGDGHRTKDGHLHHGGQWRDEQEWPLKRAVPTKYYLHPACDFARTAPVTTNSSTSFRFDPADPIPTIGGNISSGNDILLQGAWNQRGGDHVWNFKQPIPLSARNDIVVFQTSPLADDLEVTGELEANLWISSSAVDTDFTVKLIDVYPPSADWPEGFDLNIGDGILRTRFRDSLSEEKPMKPGEIYPITVRLYPTSNVFKRGHRVRVDISSSNFPRFDVNPNTGEPLNRHRGRVVATNTIWHDAAHPSHLVLPVVGR